MELMSAEVETAYVTKKLLQERVSELKMQKRECSITSNSHSNSSCLLLGNSNTHRVLRSDLATFDRLRDWVSHKLSFVTSSRFISCGLYDMLGDLSYDVILHNVGSLLSDHKDKNHNMKMYVCTSAGIM